MKARRMRVAYQSGSALDALFDEIVNIRVPINVTDGNLCTHTHVIVCSFYSSRFMFMTVA